MSHLALPKPIDRIIEAVNKNDTAAFLAFFAKDVVMVSMAQVALCS